MSIQHIVLHFLDLAELPDGCGDILSFAAESPGSLAMDISEGHQDFEVSFELPKALILRIEYHPRASAERNGRLLKGAKPPSPPNGPSEHAPAILQSVRHQEEVLRKLSGPLWVLEPLVNMLQVIGG